jgi:enoyl-CoA hydratase/carnithine racemase
MIDIQITDHVARLVLNRAPVNALNEALLAGLNEAIDSIECTPQVSVLHIRSTQKAFCAGADLAMMKGLLETAEGKDEMIAFVRRIQQLLFRLEAMGAVSVAEIGRAALGGGLELALACDFRVAADNVKLGLPEANLGLLPGAGGTQRLTRLCGGPVARRLILGAEVIDGKEAQRLGLVQWSVPAEQLETFTGELVNRLGKLPVHAVAACKRCIAAALDDSVDGYELELSETRKLHDIPESQERIQAFLEKSA